MVELRALKNKEQSICVVGLGYVGLPLAILLAKHFQVIGFDINAARITELKQGIDHTGEVDTSALAATGTTFSSDPGVIARAHFVIVAVPTPIDQYNQPDLTMLKRASETVGEHITPGSVVVYESTVYPGATEEVCVPILTERSGLVYNQNFFVGYSPERVNPGDKEHTIDKVVKVVSASSPEALAVVSGVYGTLTSVHEAPGIKVAEAAKVIENTQRDLNIALMNELAIIFSKLDISTYDVLAAAGTKWNFLPFQPGLVGGHCIGVDPYYLTHKAESLGHKPQVILAGRGVNDTMHAFVAAQLIERLKVGNGSVADMHCTIFGITFKENIPDIRNSKVALLYRELVQAGLKVAVYDPHADPAEVAAEYGITLTDQSELPPADLVIVAVAHDEFKNLTPEQLKTLFKNDTLLLADLKKLYNRTAIEAAGMEYWTL